MNGRPRQRVWAMLGEHHQHREFAPCQPDAPAGHVDEHVVEDALKRADHVAGGLAERVRHHVVGVRVSCASGPTSS
jgi:hypothetical protein